MKSFLKYFLFVDLDLFLYDEFQSNLSWINILLKYAQLKIFYIYDYLWLSMIIYDYFINYKINIF
jgi:hypothetical protein